MNSPDQGQHTVQGASPTLPEVAIEPRHGHALHGRPMDDRSELNLAHVNVWRPCFSGLDGLFVRLHAANDPFVDLRDDAETVDIFTGISRGLDKRRRLVEATAQGTRSD